MREIVKEAIKIYDADKTGRVDYALESAGKFILFNSLNNYLNYNMYFY